MIFFERNSISNPSRPIHYRLNIYIFFINRTFLSIAFKDLLGFIFLNQISRKYYIMLCQKYLAYKYSSQGSDLHLLNVKPVKG